MRNAWLRTFAALFCLAGLTATSALADPAAMVMQSRQQPKQDSTSSIWPWSKKTTPAQPAPPAAPVAPLAADRPTLHISAKQHPIQYFKAAISEMPIGSKGKAASAPRYTMPPAHQATSPVAVNTPTGPPSPELFIYAAQICEQQHDVPQARSNFDRAITMWPGNVEVLRAAARMEDRQNNLPLAEKFYQQAATSNPQNAGALNDLGLCLARQGKLEPSVQMLEQAVQLQPTKALYRNNAAKVLVEMRQDQRALGHLAAVHGPAEANYNLGQLLVESNRGADAAPYFQAALQQNPGMQPAQEALAKLQGSQLAVSVPPASVTPIAPQSAAPQQTMPVGPQYNYPATALAPTIGTSSSTTPQYLPPVASQPGPMRR